MRQMREVQRLRQHKRVPTRKLTKAWHRANRVHPRARVWAEGGTEQFLMTYIPVQRFKLNCMKSPDYAIAFGEPDA